MSLLHSGPHTVTVTPKVTTAGTMGNTKLVDGTPVTLRGVSVQPLSAEDVEQLGLSTRQAYLVIGSGTWPGGALSTVHVDVGPVPGTYDQKSPARVYGMSPRTAHYDVVITARGSEAK